MIVVLVGMMGTGKTTIGRELASLISSDFVDLDATIEHDEGMAVTELFATRGETWFRQRESNVLEELLEDFLEDRVDHAPRVIVATGGGVVTTDSARRILREAARRGADVVWLRAATATLVERLHGTVDRPLLADGDPRRTLDSLRREREAWYADVATDTIDTDVGTPEELARSLAHTLLCSDERMTDGPAASVEKQRTRGDRR